MAVISVSIPDRLLKRLDEAVHKGGFSSRSDLIRHAVEKLLEDEGDSSGSYRFIAVLSDHGETMYVDRNIVTLLHGYSEDLKGLYHQLLDGSYCITVAITRDEGEEWRSLVRRLRSLRGIKKVYTVTL